MVYQWFVIKITGTVFSCLASKLVVTVSPGLSSKSVARVSLFGPQNWQLRFGDLGLKITRRFLGLGLKTEQAIRFVSCTTKPTGGRRYGTHFGLEFPSLASRLAEAQQWVLHVTSSRRLRRVQAKDGWVDAMGCIGPFYSRIVVFYVLDPRGIVVF
jgi:hypothetical protein